MRNVSTARDVNFADAFIAHERSQRIYTGKIGCLLVMVLVPFGACLDYIVYPDKFQSFLAMRLACSVLAAGLLYLHTTKLGQKYFRLLGVPIALLPALFITWMMADTQGETSPYYAGLNLIVLSASVVVRWNITESVVAVGCIFLMYFATCYRGPTDFKMFVNNSYFLLLTGIIVVVGNYFYTQLRIQEFSLRYQLDKSKRELEEAHTQLVELDKLKSRFFANVSHEMRTPLTLLIAPLESLIRRAEGAFDSNARELLETMHNNSMRLLKLINDLLDLVRLESGRMDIRSEPLRVQDFFKGLSSAIRQVAAEKNVQVQTYVDGALKTILTDRDKLEKILLNLLFNAIKFTPSGGRIDLKAENKDNQIILTVSDTGVGIAEKNLPFVFDRFWQADNSSRRKYQGVGIGLALVKELSEMMGGGVSVTSVEGKGTAFAVTLPYKEAPPESADDRQPVPAAPTAGDAGSGEWLASLYRRAEFFAAPASRQPAASSAPVALSGRKPVALIADDEPDMQHFLRTELERDYDIIEAVDGVQALEKTELFLPDVVLLDMMMPEMDGLDVCKAMRAREATAGIPVILLTARADEETKFDALQMGANDFLAKPFSATELHARIKNLVDSHDYQRKLSKQNHALTSAIEQIKETETQLVQSEKLASLGRLSAGIIHEINNPLNFATTGIFALRNKAKNLPVAEKAQFEEILNDVDEGLRRVRNIVSDLRVFTHPESGPAESVDVAEAVNASLRFLSSEWKTKVRIENSIVPGQVAQATRNKMVHILVNLLQNSLDALSDKKFESGEPTIWIEGRVQEGKSIVVVRDNGTGIEQKNIAKIFDPFFTTKDVGEGMGLGLSICHRIARGYDGHINVRSEPGQFCEFTVDFPEKPCKAKAEDVADLPPIPVKEAKVAQA
ncbi:MAG TPA: ATP-binding protein [Candidatus Sulfotelmatobacter sp.]|nr:ATP-binding protein [Candidatus Sulfotelmatobacter sp.]